MSMAFRRGLLLMLVLAAAVIAVSCTEKEPEQTGTSSTSVQDTVTEPVAEKEKAELKEYRIIIPDVFTETEKACANGIRDTINKLTGNELAIKTDYISPAEGYDTESYEILVGNTSREETELAKSGVSYSEYSVTEYGNKIVLFSYAEAGLQTATDKFISFLKKNIPENSPEKYKISGFTDIITSFGGLSWELPVFDGGKVAGVYDCGDSATMVCLSKAGLSGIEAYFTELEGAGYTKTAENSIGKNVYRTYRGEKFNVFAYYTDAYSEVRIIQEPLKTYSMKTANAGNAETGLFATTSNDKSPYVLRLADNSLIVFDGHIYSDTDVAAQITAFFNELKEICGTGNIRITAWFISHAHADHTNMLTRLMSSSYASSIELERVIFNVSSQGDLAAVQPDAPSDYSNYLSVISTVNSYCGKYKRNTQLIKAHTGQKFEFCNSVFDILYTHEDYLPRTYPIGGNFNGNGINSHSLVMRMTVGNTVMLWTGDMSNEESAVVEKMYGNSLKCDIVQVGHHGNNTSGNVSFYQKCNPTTLVWTNSYEKFISEVVGYNRSGALVYEALKDKVTSNIYIGGDKIYKLIIPPAA